MRRAGYLQQAGFVEGSVLGSGLQVHFWHQFQNNLKFFNGWMLDARSQLRAHLQLSCTVVALNKPDSICKHTSCAQSHALVTQISGPPSIFSCVTIRQDDERKFCSAAGTLVPAIASSNISQLALYCILLPSERLSLHFQR